MLVYFILGHEGLKVVIVQVGESVEMHCEAQEAEGTQRPSVTWRRRDGLPLQKSRVRALGGNITIDTLRRQDFGIYQCVASNEVFFHMFYYLNMI